MKKLTAVAAALVLAVSGYVGVNAAASQDAPSTLAFPCCKIR